MKGLLIGYIFLLFSSSFFAQTIVSNGFLPSITASVDRANDWKLILKLESRFFRAVKNLQTEESSYNSYSLTDFSIFAQKKIAVRHSLAGGYQFRSEPNSALIHRFISQYNFSGTWGAFRTGHRIRLDGTLEESEWTGRFRYRYSIELPFSGERVDNKEFYSILNAEVLHITDNDGSELEFRCVPVIGYKFNDLNKMEIGSDIRFQDPFGSSSAVNNWLVASWFFSF